MSANRSKPTYRVFTLNDFGTKKSYINNSPLEKNEFEPNEGSVLEKGLR